MFDPSTRSPHKTCGGCTACCHIIAVAEIGVRSFAGCPHVKSPPATTPGCGIYPTRPQSCQLWSCVWLGSDWPDELRPDRCGVVFDTLADLVTLAGVEQACAQAWIAPGREAAVNRQPVLSVILAMLERLPVLCRTGSRSAFLLYRDAKGRACRSDAPPTDTGESDAARLRRAQAMLEAMP